MPHRHSVCSLRRRDVKRMKVRKCIRTFNLETVQVQGYGQHVCKHPISTRCLVNDVSVLRIPSSFFARRSTEDTGVSVARQCRTFVLREQGCQLSSPFSRLDTHQFSCPSYLSGCAVLPAPPVSSVFSGERCSAQKNSRRDDVGDIRVRLGRVNQSSFLFSHSHSSSHSYFVLLLLLLQLLQ